MSKRLSASLCILITLVAASCSKTPTVSVDEVVNPSTEVIFKEDEDLQAKLAEIAAATKGKIGVFALLMEEDRGVSYNGNERFAMQSVVKMPVAMAVMRQVSEGKFKLDEKIKFTTDDLANPGQRSPLRDKNPKGGEATIDELIRLAIVESDGTACDVLTRIAGGTAAVQSFIDSVSIVEMEMKRTHKEFGRSWDMQYENWATPEAGVALLEGLMPPTETGLRTVDPTNQIIYQRMIESIPGQNRLKGQLPPGTVVAHKTGTGGTRDGITSATNDIGIITLPSGKHIAIAVFVGDSPADENARELVIAQMAKAVWDTWSAR
jgi:beta-lactamase class A